MNTLPNGFSQAPPCKNLSCGELSALSKGNCFTGVPAARVCQECELWASCWSGMGGRPQVLLLCPTGCCAVRHLFYTWYARPGGGTGVLTGVRAHSKAARTHTFWWVLGALLSKVIKHTSLKNSESCFSQILRIVLYQPLSFVFGV